jgi:hypothetical protein
VAAAQTWELPLVPRPQRDAHLLTFKTLLDIEQAEYRAEEFTLEERVEVDEDGRRVPQVRSADAVDVDVVAQAYLPTLSRQRMGGMAFMRASIAVHLLRAAGVWGGGEGGGAATASRTP